MSFTIKLDELLTSCGDAFKATTDAAKEVGGMFCNDVDLEEAYSPADTDSGYVPFDPHNSMGTWDAPADETPADLESDLYKVNEFGL